LIAKFKNPLLVKPDSKFMRFKDKYFYCRVEDKVFEYDLYDYSKVTTTPIKKVV
jgi:hypothetical protein